MAVSRVEGDVYMHGGYESELHNDLWKFSFGSSCACSWCIVSDIYCGGRGATMDVDIWSARVPRRTRAFSAILSLYGAHWTAAVHVRWQ